MVGVNPSEFKIAGLARGPWLSQCHFGDRFLTGLKAHCPVTVQLSSRSFSGSSTPAPGPLGRCALGTACFASALSRYVLLVHELISR